MFGVVGSLIGWLSYQLGLRGDVASSTGSLHAKVKNLVENVIGDSSDGRADNTVMGWLASPIKSIQRGTVALEEYDSAIVTISSVNTSKAFLLTNFNSRSNDETPESVVTTQAGVKAVLSSATSVSFTTHAFSNGSFDVDAAWQVIEFY